MFLNGEKAGKNSKRRNVRRGEGGLTRSTYKLMHRVPEKPKNDKKS